MVKQSTINKIAKMAKNALVQRGLSMQILEELEESGVDIYEQEFCDKWSYIEGDCSCEEIIGYLAELKSFECEVIEI